MHSCVHGSNDDQKLIKIWLDLIFIVKSPLSRNIRLPDELYNKLYQIKVSLQDQYQSDAPSLQDLVSVAIEKLCDEWEDPNLQAELLEELLESRREARSRMGKRKSDSS